MGPDPRSEAYRTEINISNSNSDSNEDETNLENNNVELTIQQNMGDRYDGKPLLTSAITFKNPTPLSMESMIQTLASSVELVRDSQSNIEFTKKLKKLVEDTNLKENEEPKKVTGNMDGKCAEPPQEEVFEENPQKEVLEENPQEEVFEKNPQEEDFEKNPQEEVFEENPQEEVFEENHQNPRMRPVAFTSRANEQDSEDSSGMMDELSDSFQQTVGATRDKKLELKKSGNKKAEMRKTISVKGKKCTSIVNVTKPNYLKTVESSRRTRQNTTIELNASTSQTNQDSQSSIDTEDERDSIQKTAETIRQKDAEINKLKKENVKMKKMLENVAKVFNITLPEENKENQQSRAVIEIPEPKKGENTITMFGHSWISEIVNSSATFANNVNNRISALLRALWPDTKTRIKLVMKQRKGNKKDSIVIPEKTFNAIKDMTELLNTRKVLDMRDMKTLQDYKRVISRLIKCQRQRYAEQAKKPKKTTTKEISSPLPIGKKK
ncbi:uncharacterized protein [Venturia canescens]|uniref:uncharacterized protein n=1 Tax=Venturia canescens TaxID=32260 RepID=UPI001C9D2781|nr:uncharacterized protein LOC122411876 [Venturia canescens]